MISIASLLRVESRLIPIQEVGEYQGDLDYIEGALVLEVNGRELMSRGQWDYIDQLWYLLLDAVHQALVGETTVEFTYPDEPVVVRIDATSRHALRLHVAGQSMTFDKDSFVPCLLTAARHFQGELARLIGESEVASFAALIDDLDEAANSQRAHSP